MFLARQFSAAVTASLLVASAFFVIVFSVSDLHAKNPGSSCAGAAEVAVLSSPIAPWKGAPLRVVFAAEEPLEGELSLIAPDGKETAKSRERHGGPPYFWFAEVASPAVGTWHATLAREGAPAGCSTVTRKIAVSRNQPHRHARRQGASGPFAMHGIAGLKTCILHGSRSSSMRRSTKSCRGRRCTKCCAIDRAISSSTIWVCAKTRRGSSFVPTALTFPTFYARISRSKWGCPSGTRSARAAVAASHRNAHSGGIFRKRSSPPPRLSKKLRPLVCSDSCQPIEPPAKIPQRPQGLVPGFGFYVGRTVADGVQSGNGRTSASDDDTDYYPVTLKEETLRPGTIYADPYGHVLVLAKRIPQSDSAAGIFLAVDAQPDGTVARKRFWRGNFLFAQDPSLGSPGFKRFRPIVREKGALWRLTNAEIAKNPQYGDFSLEQSQARDRRLLRSNG